MRYQALGVMSGTSLDGIDIVWVEFDKKNNHWNYSVLLGETLPYSEYWLKKLSNISDMSASEVQRADYEYTTYLNEIFRNFIKKHHISHLDFIASHGHTVWHQPKQKITLQIGNLAHIAKDLPCVVVCDFRKADVKLGGQGAPLVPIGDKLLFSDYTFCLNLGGFSNISYDLEGKRMAYDICAVNTVLNDLAQKLGYAYDKDGQLSKKGKCQAGLLNQLNNVTFYRLNPPKSLGIEWVKNEIFPIIYAYDCSLEDKIRTYVEHISDQISFVLKDKSGKLLISGGGAHHPLIVDLRTSKSPQIEIIKPDEQTINFKEAIVFAFLGLLRLQGENNVLSSVTGAPKDHCSGVVFTNFT